MHPDVVYGLTAAVAFGSADFLARQVTHRVGFFTTLFILQLIGALILVPPALLAERHLWQAADPWAFLFGLGVLNLLASLSLYRAFEYGVLSVVAPLVSLSPAVATALAAACPTVWVMLSSHAVTPNPAAMSAHLPVSVSSGLPEASRRTSISV